MRFFSHTSLTIQTPSNLFGVMELEGVSAAILDLAGPTNAQVGNLRMCSSKAAFVPTVSAPFQSSAAPAHGSGELRQMWAPRHSPLFHSGSTHRKTTRIVLELAPPWCSRTHRRQYAEKPQ